MEIWDNCTDPDKIVSMTNKLHSSSQFVWLAYKWTTEISGLIAEDNQYAAPLLFRNFFKLHLNRYRDDITSQLGRTDFHGGLGFYYFRYVQAIRRVDYVEMSIMAFKMHILIRTARFLKIVRPDKPLRSAKKKAHRQSLFEAELVKAQLNAQEYKCIASESFCQEFRDTAANMHCNCTLDRSYVTDTVSSMAKLMLCYDSYTNMRELGNLLLDSGCNDPAVLDHCFQPQHYRGCWLLNAILHE
jgi:tRNA G10  N-methylase Trm11